jgi:hypothetical protein
MGWLGSLRGRKLRPSYQFTTHGVLWRLVPSRGGIAAGEDRDQSSKRVTFFSIDLVTGHVFWRDRSSEEPWWVGIEAVHDGVVLLHGYRTPDMPEHRGLEAVDARTGETLWRNGELAFFLARGEQVYAVRETFESRIFLSLSLKDGSAAGEVPPEEIQRLRRQTRDEEGEAGIRFPRIASRSETEEPGIAGHIRKATRGSGTLHLVEYLEAGRAAAIGYYQREARGAPHLVQQLVVMNARTGAVVYREKLSAHAALALPERFFLFQNFLFFIKESTTLTALDLTDYGKD